MSNAVHDLKKCVFTVESEVFTGRIPGSGDGDFLTLEIPESYTVEAAMGDGQSVVSSMQGRDVPGTFTVGPYSEAYRVLGLLYEAQETKRKLGVPFQGFPAQFLNSGNGTQASTSAFLIRRGPQITEAQGVTMAQWEIVMRSATWKFGQSIPVGGGSL